MLRKFRGRLLLATGLLSFSVVGQAAVIDFDDNVLAPDSFFDPQANTTWSSGGLTFEHGWNADFNCCWSDFTYSNKTDTTTAGFLNDRSAITGDGVGAGQDNYAMVTTGLNSPRVMFGEALFVQGSYFTNSTYAYLAMVNGDDGNNPAFVKGPFEAGDFFTLTITGLDAVGQAISSRDFRLAKGADVLSTWKWANLNSLGQVYGLEFSLTSSDSGEFGSNTPAYFAMDNLTITAVPLPAGVWLFLSAIGALGLRSKQLLKR